MRRLLRFIMGGFKTGPTHNHPKGYFRMNCPNQECKHRLTLLLGETWMQNERDRR